MGSDGVRSPELTTHGRAPGCASTAVAAVCFRAHIWSPSSPPKGVEPDEVAFEARPPRPPRGRGGRARGERVAWADVYDRDRRRRPQNRRISRRGALSEDGRGSADGPRAAAGVGLAAVTIARSSKHAAARRWYGSRADSSRSAAAATSARRFHRDRSAGERRPVASQIRNVATGSVSHRQGRRRFARRALARSKALFRHQTPGGGISRRHSLIHASAGSAPAAAATRPVAPDSLRIAAIVSDDGAPGRRRPASVEELDA